MGSSTEMKRGAGKYRADVIIPWNLVPGDVWQSLVFKLNIPMAIGGMDWTMLASKLGYTQQEIMFIESEKDTNTKVLFRMYSQRKESSVNEIYTCLEEMERRDCLEIIDKAYEEMYKRATVPEYYQPDGAEGHSFGQFSCFSTLKCPNHQSSVHMSPSHCSCFCSAHVLPYHHLPPPLSHPECQGRVRPCLHDRNGTFPSLHSPQHSPTTDQGRLVHSQHTNSLPGSMHNNISPFDNSNISGNYNSLETINTQAKMARQYSDECNASQGYTGEDRPYQNGNYAMDSFPSANADFRCSLPGQKGAGAMAQHSSAGSPAKCLQPKPNYVNGQIYTASSSHSSPQGPSSHAEHNGACVKGEQSLALLKSMVDCHEKYRPTPEYTDVVADQKINSDKKSRSEKPSLDSFGSHSSSSSGGSSSGRSRPSSTFPLRIKNRTPVEDMSQLKISKKSTSMPQNMKPAEYRKVFRNTKVFVTYSFDNESHGKQVLSLCKFLQTNGFACYVDVKEKDAANIVDWCSKKMSEADFILACISPKYLQEIKGGQNRNFQPGSERQLHTKEIYTLMENGHLKGHPAARCTQIVPLLFGGTPAAGLPQWMVTNRPVYVWPDQYLDLAWLLTKPQERIKVSRGCTNRAEGKNHEQSAPSSLEHESMSVDCYS